MTPIIKPTWKQHLAYQALKDPIIKYPFFGGGAGGGKTWLGCEWETTSCYFYPETRWFIGREELSRLYQTTFLTLMKVFKAHGIPRSDWKLNGKYNYIEFIEGKAKGSRIDFLDLKYFPGDPLYERFGSYEFTGGWIEEAGEIEFKAFDVLKSRVGRHLNDHYNLPPKLLNTMNPKKGWIYRDIYKPHKEGILDPEFTFIQALYSDNEYSAKTYEAQLKSIKDQATKERLMFGNWEYDDDPAVLIPYDTILDLFTNPIEIDKERYMTIDVARLGKDKIVYMCWQGLHCYKIVVKTKQRITDTIADGKKLAEQEKIPASHVIADEDGVGGGVVDGWSGIKGFIANSTPFVDRITGKPENFENLKTQCAYKFADLANDHKVKVTVEDQKMKEEIIQEVEQLKSRDADKDGKKKIVQKEKIKELIGRSPDFLDNFIMRGWFEYRKPRMPEFRVLG